MIYMVCYDISDPKRLSKTAKIIENFGIRVQYSFFQCDMPKNKLEEMKNKVLSVINEKKDSFFIYPLCEECSKKAEVDGKGELIRLDTYRIV